VSSLPFRVFLFGTPPPRFRSVLCISRRSWMDRKGRTTPHVRFSEMQGFRGVCTEIAGWYRIFCTNSADTECFADGARSDSAKCRLSVGRSTRMSAEYWILRMTAPTLNVSRRVYVSIQGNAGFSGGDVQDVLYGTGSSLQSLPTLNISRSAYVLHQKNTGSPEAWVQNSPGCTNFSVSSPPDPGWIGDPGRFPSVPPRRFESSVREGRSRTHLPGHGHRHGGVRHTDPPRTGAKW